MKPGDFVTATWSDGHSVAGVYARTERGYVVILDLKTNKEVPCNMNNVKIEPGKRLDLHDAEKVVRNIQMFVSFCWGFLVGVVGYLLITL